MYRLKATNWPMFSHSITEKNLYQERSQTNKRALETEAGVQATCRKTRDFERAYNAFVAKQKPVFEGN